MPPPSDHPSFHLHVLPGGFFVVKLQTNEDVPQSILKALVDDSTRFLSLTRTRDEISLVGETQNWMPEKIQAHSTWKCIKISGPMEHDLTGVLAAFTTPLRPAKVPIFATSTWDTDYVLVPQEKLGDAVHALENDGWVFPSAGER